MTRAAYLRKSTLSCIEKSLIQCHPTQAILMATADFVDYLHLILLFEMRHHFFDIALQVVPIHRRAKSDIDALNPHVLKTPDEIDGFLYASRDRAGWVDVGCPIRIHVETQIHARVDLIVVASMFVAGCL